MPIYEFYCVDCHRVFSFLSRRVRPRRRPDCPDCGRKRIERRASAFAVAGGRAEPPAETGGEIDDSRVERAMASLAADAERIGDDDPRAMAGLVRRMYDASGLPLGPGMDEAIRRMESGEDPDRIEDEMGEILEAEDPFADGPEEVRPGGAAARRLPPPTVDTTLYEL
ncbi:MAG TPA: zinc ribbon domain-containing protein [Candidatus Polarisedimenticolaceae bacterium]|nr:zinc ribbon domain-containing protein [Candidatus Polarisedimenticolaceae bacterium]